MTTWPSGLRRVTRNHFSSGGVGSNPAVVVFYTSFSIPFFPSSKKMVPPRFELGSREPESHMLPLHHGTLRYIPYSSLLIPHLSLFFTCSFSYLHDDYPSILFLCPYILLLSVSMCLLFLSCSVFFIKKRLPWVSNPRPYG